MGGVTTGAGYGYGWNPGEQQPVNQGPTPPGYSWDSVQGKYVPTAQSAPAQNQLFNDLTGGLSGAVNGLTAAGGAAGGAGGSTGTGTVGTSGGSSVGTGSSTTGAGGAPGGSAT